MNILDKIVEVTKDRVSEYKKKDDFKSIRKRAEEFQVISSYSFHNALKEEDISFICEVKKASPTLGVISEDFDYINISKEYKKAGASAISCLTEPYFFKGSDEYIKEIKESVSLPILRKDFIIDEYMIYQAVILEADAVLLIANILDEYQLKDYLDITKSLKISALVEVHDEYELEKAMKAESDIIGVNNRDLKTFHVDINNSIRIGKLIPDNVLFISESGIKSYEDIKKLKENGADGVLIGETLMKSENKVEALKKLKGLA